LLIRGSQDWSVKKSLVSSASTLVPRWEHSTKLK
jgi:hypothetical protein